MAETVKVYDYTAESTEIEITNVIDKASAKACDAGSPVQKVEMKYDDIKDIPCVKFDYLFNRDGSFKVDEDGNYIVAVHQKYKNTDRVVPAYRTMNNKLVLKIGDSMKFNTARKDEIVFYEKFAAAFAGELEVKIGGKVVGVDYGVAAESTDATEGDA